MDGAILGEAVGPGDGEIEGLADGLADVDGRAVGLADPLDVGVGLVEPDAVGVGLTELDEVDVGVGFGFGVGVLLFPLQAVVRIVTTPALARKTLRLVAATRSQRRSIVTPSEHWVCLSVRAAT